MKSIYDIQVEKMNGEKISLNEFKDNILLIVNTATKCGFTKQYEGLEKLFKKYHDKGFYILDFPCNQFLGQAPGKIEDIKTFCELNFQTTFPLFNKIYVNGTKTSELYQFLKDNGPDEMVKDGEIKPKRSKRIRWNFTKFLIDRQGNILYRFSPKFTPEEIDKYIEKLL